MKLLITGGARSGKTRYALRWASAFANPTYIATAELLDDEMIERARRHRAERGPQWRTIEEPLAVADHVAETRECVVLDCLTLWLSNWMLHDEGQVDKQIEVLAAAVRSTDCNLAIITNEVGSSIVPDNRLAREFREWAGILNQQIAAVVDEVYLMICALPLRVKP